jgi:hypothetical protein
MTVSEAVTLVQALRDLTEETGTVTSRAQSKILRELPDADLVRVAVELKQRQRVRNILSGRTAEGNRANLAL